MIFSPENVDLIRKGEKTMTRRPVKRGEERCRYRPGRSYAVQPGRGKKANQRIVITDVHAEQLREITDEDAVAEGFEDREAFLEYWAALHEGIDLDQEVWVISFVLEKRGTERFLGRAGGYIEQIPGSVPVEQAVISTTDEDGPEPQAIDEATQDRYTAEGWERFSRRRPELDLETRLKVCRAEAKEKGIDASRLEASIEKRIAAYERIVRAEKAAA